MNKIYFYGSFHPKNKASYGGGEEGNLRTVSILRSAGYDVRIIRKLRSRASTSKFVKLASYPIRMMDGILKFLFILLFGCRKSIVHISGFCGHTILNEYILMKISKALGYFSIFELRGGGADKFYYNGSAAYRKMFRWIVTNADYIFSQGMENKQLLDSICNTPFFYYPNYVEENFLPSSLPIKPTDSINLLFFGRVEKEKNVLLIVDTAAILQKELNNITLTIIGNGKPEYTHDVQQRMKERLRAGSFIYIPGCKHDDLKHHLADKHFYIFPSQQEYEGHSNAVTEAMAYGVVPIVSPQGFSRTIVGNDELVISELNATEYAKCISDKLNAGNFDEFSRNVYQRIQNNYTAEIVGKKLVQVYKEIAKECPPM